MPAVLVRTVMIRGSLILTTHRLCFLAFLPSMAELKKIHHRSQSHGDDGGASEPIAEAIIIKKGNATEHRRGWAPRRRVWVELRADSLSFYPSSDKLYEPLESIRFSDVETLHTVDWRRATWISFTASGHLRSLEFGTEESALQWRKELEAALWKFRHTAEKIHISVPLPRIKTVEQFAFLSFARCIQLLIQDGTSLPQPSSADDSSTDQDTTTDVTFGLVESQAFIKDMLEKTLQASKRWRENIGWEKALKLVPRPLIALDGALTKEEEEESNSASEAEDSDAEDQASKFDQFTALRVRRFRKEFSLRKDVEIKSESALNHCFLSDTDSRSCVQSSVLRWSAHFRQQALSASTVTLSASGGVA